MAKYADPAWWMNKVYHEHGGYLLLPFGEVAETPEAFAEGVEQAGAEAGRNAIVRLETTRRMFHIHVD